MTDQPGLSNGRNSMDKCFRHAAAIETFMEIARALASPGDIREILEQIMIQVSQLLRPKDWSLLLRDESAGGLECTAAISATAEKLKGMLLPAGQGVAGWVAEHGEALIIPDVHRDPRFAEEFNKQHSFVACSILCVPIKNNDQVFGVIKLINSLEDGIFDVADEQILTTIADFAGMAISNAKAMTKIKQLVITDDLTGLYNSRYFFEQIEYEIERAKRYHCPLSLVFLDLDRFKIVNDTYGHLVGSRLLAEVGTIVQSSIRKTDKAARYGGDEFVIILPQKGKSGARSLAVKLQEALQNRRFVSSSGDLLTVTGSFGVASFPEDAQSSSELINAADEAMYEVKASGRNGVRVAGSGRTYAGQNR